MCSLDRPRFLPQNLAEAPIAIRPPADDVGVASGAKKFTFALGPTAFTLKDSDAALVAPLKVTLSRPTSDTFTTSGSVSSSRMPRAPILLVARRP
ncbi:hypothetical protein H074_28398 [Amycolatopsis decaplanina DSM 44594]|uniref:Uncharacterized protein n=1 Tax=Amycolatopsis decaplanina DSM 44594 TaxID=1284240 RepID=M2YHW7_9PSEU|nr:hypothetical protein H074_28398 [Amycolatopsis decaplanina DSM 44594]